MSLYQKRHENNKTKLSVYQSWKKSQTIESCRLTHTVYKSGGTIFLLNLLFLVNGIIEANLHDARVSECEIRGPIVSTQ